jgi:hypothetical protein
MLRLVPFNNAWVQHDKLDLHAIYKRPQYVRNDYDEEVLKRDENGQVCYDLTTPLPVRQHNKWAGKGFVYVTLATRGDLKSAHEKGTLLNDKGHPVHWKEYDQHQTGGPWHWKMYLDGQQGVDASYLTVLESQVRRFGSEAVEELRREQDPNFVLPAHLRGIAVGGGPVVGARGNLTPADGSTPHGESDPASAKAQSPKPRAQSARAATASQLADSGDAELVGGFKA